LIDGSRTILRTLSACLRTVSSFSFSLNVISIDRDRSLGFKRFFKIIT
jgi:hypothetical protein